MGKTSKNLLAALLRNATLICLSATSLSFGVELGCSVEMDRLTVPRNIADKYGISTVKFSYAFNLPENSCVELLDSALANPKKVEPDGCLNGLGYIGTIQFRFAGNDTLKVDEVVLSCDGFKVGTFQKKSEWFEFRMPEKFRQILLKIEADSEEFHERSIDSTYYYKKLR